MAENEPGAIAAGEGDMVERVLALVPNWLGDVAMCTPALRALRMRFPQAHLTIAGNAAACGLLEDIPWINALAPVPARITLSEMMCLSRQLRSMGRDVIVVFPHSFRAALFAWLIGGKRRIGYRRNGRRILLTRTRMPHRENGHITPVYMAREYLELVELLGALDDGQGLELGVSGADLEQARHHLSGQGPLVGIAPGAAFGPAKRWMPGAFAETADRLASACGARFVLLTGPGEESLADAVTSRASTPFLSPPPTLSGIAALKASIASADLIICNDSGPRHIAVAFKRPVICIMGPTSPQYTDSPYERGQVLRRTLPCSPCQKPECPLGHHRCMREITPDEVVGAAARWLMNAMSPVGQQG